MSTGARLVRGIGILVAGGLAAVGAGLLAMALVAVVQLRSDLPPAGPGCDYELSDGSGGSPGGVERIEWRPIPERRCEVVDGPLAGQRFTGTLDDPVRGMVVLLAGITAASLVGAATVVRLVRRPEDPLVSGVEPPHVEV